jgi:hypothetical protein
VKRYSRVEDVVTIGSHPLLIPPIRAEHCHPAAAVRQSGYLPYIGGPWALRAPLTAGLPFSQRTHGRAHLATNAPYSQSQRHATPLGETVSLGPERDGASM